MNSGLPEFAKAPVSEVAISVQFAPLENWGGHYAGIFWNEVKGAYPKIQSLSPIPFNSENFEELEFRQPQIMVSSADVDQRTWFLTEATERLIQIQRDRFAINWRRVTDEQYPRYEKEMRPRFIAEWGLFKKFLEQQNLGEIDVLQSEVTYINDFVQGEHWETIPDVLSLLSIFSEKKTTGFLPGLETITANGSFKMPLDAGRLHFHIQHLLRQSDMKQVVQLRLTSRGKPQASDDASILDWLDLAREWVVRGFAEMTSERGHTAWGRTR